MRMRSLLILAILSYSNLTYANLEDSLRLPVKKLGVTTNVDKLDAAYFQCGRQMLKTLFEGIDIFPQCGTEKLCSSANSNIYCSEDQSKRCKVEIRNFSTYTMINRAFPPQADEFTWYEDGNGDKFQGLWSLEFNYVWSSRGFNSSMIEVEVNSTPEGLLSVNYSKFLGEKYRLTTLGAFPRIHAEVVDKTKCHDVLGVRKCEPSVYEFSDFHWILDKNFTIEMSWKNTDTSRVTSEKSNLVSFMSCVEGMM